MGSPDAGFLRSIFCGAAQMIRRFFCGVPRRRTSVSVATFFRLVRFIRFRFQGLADHPGAAIGQLRAEVSRACLTEVIGGLDVHANFVEPLSSCNPKSVSNNQDKENAACDND